MKLSGSPFENSPVCKGIGYVDGAVNMDIARIELAGRYPERGWVMNETIYEIAYVLEGNGVFITSDREALEISTGDVLSIVAGKKYAWDGIMTLIVACNPPFDPDQHKELEES